MAGSFGEGGAIYSREEDMKCVKCGGDLPVQSGVGRPRKFCSSACLKLATKEVRRLDALIGSLEGQESQARMGGYHKHVAVLRAEIGRLEERMASLIDSDIDTAAA